MSVPFSREQAIAKQKFCNVCHAGCLDCHYEPTKEKGAHHFVNRPTSASCGGYGRNTSMCHAGSLHSRRGGTYVGGSYSVPEDMKPDVHLKKNIHCVDCHQTGPKGMGDLQRKATCQDCHIDIEEAHAQSIHKNLDCSSCHVSEARGYQGVTWGPGEVAGADNPFKKYSLYYGIQGPPILMKDQKGKWMAVKVFPHTVGNIQPDVPASGTIKYRWPGGETKDPYYVIGTMNAGPDNKHLLWLEIQHLNHPYGKARSCDSCHGPKQIARSKWEFQDDQGAESPFTGSYSIVADASGLRITDIRSGKIVPEEGRKPEDFAAWIMFRDAWNMPGDFSIRTDPGKYRKYKDLSGRITAELRRIEKGQPADDAKRKRKYNEVKGAVLHNEDIAFDRIREFTAAAPRKAAR